MLLNWWMTWKKVWRPLQNGKKLGLKVNDSKAEACLFHRSYQEIITLTVNGSTIRSKTNMNVL